VFCAARLFPQTLLELDAQQAGFKSEISKAQDLHVTTLNRESERLSNDVSKVRSEIKCAPPCCRPVSPRCRTVSLLMCVEAEMIAGARRCY